MIKIITQYIPKTKATNQAAAGNTAHNMKNNISATM
jgi:hypothetical protein